MHHPQAWMIDTNWAPVRLEHVRMEGCSGVLRATGKGMRNSRFNDMLIDVNAVTTGGLSGCAIEYHKAGPIWRGSSVSLMGTIRYWRRRVGRPVRFG